MGDRISISFVNGREESVTLFSHWAGRSFLNQVQKYLKELHTEIENNKSNIEEPIHRLEPQTAIVDFIRWLTKDSERVTSDLYLGKDANDGDNSDNGHFAIDLKTGEYI